MRLGQRPVGYSMFCRRRLFAMGIVLTTGLCGCKETTPSHGPGVSTSMGLPHGEASSEGATVSPDEILPSDPTAVRLQNIGGYLLLYYRLHSEMPGTLEDLRSVAAGDAQLNFTSPTSGHAYEYAAAGLWQPGRGDKCIVAYDDSPTKDDRFWCLFMDLPKAAGGSMSVDVVEVPRGIVSKYHAPGN